MTLKILQWSTGRVGMACLRAIAARRDVELVGVGVYDPVKIGRDAGEIAGIQPLGIRAVNVADLIDMPADCVLYTPIGERSPDQAVDDICLLLRSGKNVCSTALMALNHPNTMSHAHRHAIEAACRGGGSTFHAAGINPGFFADVMSLTLSSLCARVDRIHAVEIYDYSRHSSPSTVTELLGFGRPVPLDLAETAKVAGSVAAAPLCLLADAMDFRIDNIEADVAFRAAAEDFEIAVGTVRKDMLAGRRKTYRAFSEGVERVRLEYVGRAASHVAPDWPSPARDGLHRWENRIYGEPDLISSVEIGLDDPENVSGAVATGMRAVNALKAVCEAEAGIATALTLGILRAPMA